MVNSDWERRQRAAAREAERLARQAERDRINAEKERKRRHLEARKADTERKNRELAGTFEALRMILVDGIQHSAQLDLNSLRRKLTVAPLRLGNLGIPISPPVWTDYAPQKPGFFARLFGGQTRYEQELAEAKAAFSHAEHEAAAAERDRQARVTAAEQQHAESMRLEEEDIDAHN
ncbi:hypothetical protein ACW9HQ_49980, partial [Nocardia gipuzkoensis]